MIRRAAQIVALLVAYALGSLGLVLTHAVAPIVPSVTDSSGTRVLTEGMVVEPSATFSTDGTDADYDIVRFRHLGANNPDTVAPFTYDPAGDLADGPHSIEFSGKIAGTSTFDVVTVGFEVVSAHVPPAPSGGDDTAAIEAFLEGVPANALVRFPADASYIVDGEIKPAPIASGLEIDGNGATFTRSTIDAGSVFYFERCADLEFHSFHIVGPNPSATYPKDPLYEVEHGVRLGDCHGVTLHDATVRNVWGDFIYIGNARDLETGAHLPNTDVEVYNFAGSISGRQGISPTHVVGLILRDTVLDEIPRSVIDMEPQPQWNVADVLIERVTASNYSNMFVANGGGGASGNMTVRDNHAVGKWFTVGIGNSNSPLRCGYVFDGNTGDLVSGSPRLFWLRHACDVQVINNANPGASNRTAVQADLGTHDVEVAFNSFPGMGTVLAADATTSNCVEHDNVT